MKNLCLFLILWMHFLYATESDIFQCILGEVELDATLSCEEQQDKISEFKTLVNTLSPQAACDLTDLLLEETRSRIVDMLQNAGLDSLEIASYEKGLFEVDNMTVEVARGMLFFVAELKIHRQFVYDFGMALGCPEKQLLRHDLCKLSAGQFEGYARYFRGGRREEDRERYLAAWQLHQCAEHHHQSYSKEGFSFDNYSEERLRNNMLEIVADLLAATQQRGGGTVIDYLITIFPKQNPHRRLLPFLEEALRKAQALGFPCWNRDVEEVFNLNFGFIL